METQFIKALNKKQTDIIPMWMMRQAGRYLPEYRKVRKQAGSFLDLCYTPNLASEVTLQPLRRYDLDAAIIFSDILVIPHALGQKVWFVEGEGPKLKKITKAMDLNPDKFLEFLNPVFETLDKTRSALPNDKSLIGFAGAPWTLACYMINGQGSRDYQNVRLFARQNPQDFQNLLDVLVESISIYLVQKIKAGANAIQIFDSWAGVLSCDEFQKYSINPTAKIIAKVKQVYPNVPIIGFPRGVGFNYQSYIEQTGIDAVSCDQAVPLDQMKKFQNHVCVQGNLDNLLLLKGGQEMVEQAQIICRKLSDKPFVFNLGHGVIKDTNPDDVALLVDTVRNFKNKELKNVS